MTDKTPDVLDGAIRYWKDRADQAEAALAEARGLLERWMDPDYRNTRPVLDTDAFLLAARPAPAECSSPENHIGRKHDRAASAQAPEPACGQWPCAGEPYCDESAHPRSPYYRAPTPATRCRCGVGTWSVDTVHLQDCPARRGAP